MNIFLKRKLKALGASYNDLDKINEARELIKSTPFISTVNPDKEEKKYKKHMKVLSNPDSEYQPLGEIYQRVFNDYMNNPAWTAALNPEGPSVIYDSEDSEKKESLGSGSVRQ